MPLRSGYSYATYQANVAEMVAYGHERTAAIMASASHARKCFFKKHPYGLLPMWLAFPKTHRSRMYYTEGGHPLLALSKTVATNPRADFDAPYTHHATPDLKQATALYRGFTGKQPRTLRRLDIPPLPKSGLAIGKVFGIMYSVDATNERFHHEFKGKARPTLIVASDGKSVYLRGGAYTFTKRGFTDSK